jgi:hypothetical protein
VISWLKGLVVVVVVLESGFFKKLGSGVWIVVFIYGFQDLRRATTFLTGKKLALAGFDQLLGFLETGNLVFRNRTRN